MPGSKVTLGDDPGRRTSSMVAALNRLPHEPQWAVVGRFAVIIRSAQVHRLTNDVDTISRDKPQFMELLTAEPDITKLSSASLRIDGNSMPVDLDVMDDSTGLPLPAEPGERAFTLARRHALASSETMGLAVTNGSQIVSQSQARVATTASLIILKAVALPRRASSPNPQKVGSDIHDLVRLARSCDFIAATSELANSGEELVSWVGETLTKWFSPDHDQRYTLARLRRFSSPSEINSLTEDDLTIVAQLAQSLS